MATRGVQFVGYYGAWDTSANAWKTGDAAQHTASWVKDGTRSATTNAAAEVDATNVPGRYKVTVTATEADCLSGELGGKSSTANVILIPTTYAFEYVPNAAAGANGGLPTVDANNAVKLQAGTGTGQLDFASGVVKANLVQILATALTEGLAGRLANAFKTLFDVASPVLTAASVNQTGDAYARIGANGVGLTQVAIATGGIPSGAHAAAELNNIADAMLDRNMASGTDSGTDSTATRTVRQALRVLRNKVDATLGRVYKEDDVTVSWTFAVTTAAGNPTTVIDPT